MLSHFTSHFLFSLLNCGNYVYDVPVACCCRCCRCWLMWLNWWWRSMFLLFYFCSQFLISKHRHRLCMDQSHHLSEALSILYNSEKIRILDSSFDENAGLGIKIMFDLRYLEIPSLDISIGTLQNLEFLLLKDNYDIHIPMYLLNMPKLRHLHAGNQIRGAKFSENCDNSQINNL